MGHVETFHRITDFDRIRIGVGNSDGIPIFSVQENGVEVFAGASWRPDASVEVWDGQTYRRMDLEVLMRCARAFGDAVEGEDSRLPVRVG